jgi:hypothetical protein
MLYRITTVCILWTMSVSLALCAAAVFADPPPTADKSSDAQKPVAKDETSEKEILLTVTEARAQARLLHETYEATLRALHRRYFRDDGKLPVPSRVLDEVFSDLSYRSNVKARWLAVNAQAMSLDHEPKDEFEKQAVRRLSSGKDEFEAVENGIYRRAGSIALFTSCIKCHAPAPMRQDVHRVAGLIISMPVKED